MRAPAPLRLLLLIFAALIGGELVPSEAGAPLRFDVHEDAFVRYAIKHLHRSDSRAPRGGRRGRVDDVAGFMGYEIDDTGRRIVRPTHHLELLYVPYVFWLPRNATPGKRQKIREHRAQTWRMAPIEVDGWHEPRIAAEGADAVAITGHVTFRPGRARPARDGHTYRRLVEGSLRWSATFDRKRAVVTTASYTLEWRTERATDDRPRAVSFVDPAPRRFEAQVRLTLERVLAHRYPSFQNEVDDAVERGLALLLARQRKDGQWADSDPAGMTALALLTLLDGGTPPEHAAVERGFRWLLRQQPWAGIGTSKPTYATGLCMMALEARRIPATERAARRRGERPMVGPRRLEPLEAGFMRRCVDALLASAARRPLTGATRTGEARPLRWGYELTAGRDGHAGGYDNSNTQYAVLGLESAARCGIEVPQHAWLGIAEHFLQTQVGEGPAPRAFSLVPQEAPRAEPGARGVRGAHRYGASKRRGYGPFVRTARSRGWHYRDPRHPGPGVSPAALCYGSMTATGIASLAIARARLEPKKRRVHRERLKRIDQAIVDGFVALDDMFTVWGHPQYEGWYLYYLYALERAGMLAGIERFGSHDWYWEGAVQLLSRLRPSRRGRPVQYGWSYHIGDVGSTCFAILFLKRGTIPVVTPR